MGEKMKIRQMKGEDGAETLRLFQDTVRAVCAGDYSPAQLRAWIGERSLRDWTGSFFTEGRRALVAEEGGEIVGFADMTQDGYFDRLYVHKNFQRRGIAAALADALEEGCAASSFTVYASVTARGFFEKRGYVLVRENIVERGGEKLLNYYMRKENLRALR